MNPAMLQKSYAAYPKLHKYFHNEPYLDPEKEPEERCHMHRVTISNNSKCKSYDFMLCLPVSSLTSGCVRTAYIY